MEEDRMPEETPASSAPPSRWLTALLVLSFGVTLCFFAYAVGERRLAARLAAEKSQLAASLSQTQSQVDALTSRLNAMSVQAPASPSPPQPTPEETKPEETHRPAQANATHKARRPSAVENQRWKKIENRLAEQQEAIATTQQDLEKTRTDLEGKLTSTHDELSGSIAKTHDELVALEKKGERYYYEFDLQKSKEFRRVGPLSLSLRKINTKHEYYDMTMVVDDRQLSKKHVNLYEPVWIYPADSHHPLQVVVNQISKDAVHGYLSAPKYTESQDAASPAAASTAPVPATSGNATGSTTSGDSSPTQDSLSHRPSERL